MRFAIGLANLRRAGKLRQRSYVPMFLLRPRHGRSCGAASATAAAAVEAAQMAAAAVAVGKQLEFLTFRTFSNFSNHFAQFWPLLDHVATCLDVFQGIQVDAQHVMVISNTFLFEYISIFWSFGVLSGSVRDPLGVRSGQFRANFELNISEPKILIFKRF